MKFDWTNIQHIDLSYSDIPHVIVNVGNDCYRFNLEYPEHRAILSIIAELASGENERLIKTPYHLQHKRPVSYKTEHRAYKLLKWFGFYGIMKRTKPH